MIFRPIEESDDQPLAALIRNIFDEFDVPKQGTVYTDPTTDRLYEVFQRPRSAYRVVVNNNDIIGGCGHFPTDGLPADHAELVKLYVAATARKQGLGRALMELTFKDARADGYKFLYLESFPHFSRALTLYESLGFERLSQPMGNSGHHACSIWMIKQL
jgi:putative acetyltransferase